MAGTGAGQGTQPIGVNNAGQIVGEYEDSSGIEHGFVYVNGEFITVSGGGDGLYGSVVTGIDNAGQITGWYNDADGNAFGFIGNAATPVVTVDNGGTLDINIPAAYDVTFAGNNGTVIFDQPAAFTGEISGITPGNSNQVLDFKGFGTDISAEERRLRFHDRHDAARAA